MTEYPLTPKSTVNYWAKEGYFKNNGPLAGIVERIKGRWYVKTGSNNSVVNNIVKTITKSIKGE